MSAQPVLAVIPARGGSKGLPGKNIKLLAGLPLIAHSIRCAAMCPEIGHTVVSTDSEEISRVAREHGCDVPFLRPPELATDTAAMPPVLQHALREIERYAGRRFASLLLLDPTSPGRLPSDVAGAVQILEDHPGADSVIAVSEPDFNPLWHSVVEKGGFLAPLIGGVEGYSRRQDVPKTYRINAMLYLFRRRYLLDLKEPWNWIAQGHHKLLVLPEGRAIHIDDAEQFARAELLIRHGFIVMPWLPGGL